jgi:cytochrome c oxidase assembly factor CtaG
MAQTISKFRPSCFWRFEPPLKLPTSYLLAFFCRQAANIKFERTVVTAQTVSKFRPSCFWRFEPPLKLPMSYLLAFFCCQLVASKFKVCDSFAYF